MAVVTEPPAREPRADIRQLTGLRGVLALDVVVGHLSGGRMPLVGRIVFHNAAVDYFFALSGFVLGLTYAATSKVSLDFADYCKARFARIYPLYLFSLLSMAFLLAHWREGDFADEPPSRLARAFVSQLLLLGCLPIRATAGFWDVPAWSVSAEAVCYLCLFQVLVVATRRCGSRSAPFCLVVAVLAAAGDVAFQRAFFDPVVLGIQRVPLPCGPVWWVAMVRVGTMFAAGWVGFIALRDPRLRPGVLRAGADILGAAFLAILLLGGETPTDRQWLVLLAPLLIVCLSADGSVPARLLSLGPVVYLGRISYSLYLLHVPVLLMALHCPWLAARPSRLMAGTIIAAIAVASVTQAAIEAPMRRWIRGRGRLGRA